MKQRMSSGNDRFKAVKILNNAEIQFFLFVFSLCTNYIITVIF